MRDTNLCLKTSGAQTTTTTGSVVDFGGPDIMPLTYTLNCTAASGTSPTLDVVVQECATSGGTYVTALTFPQLTAAGVKRITGKLDGRYRKYVATIAGTSPSFTYEIYPEMGGEYVDF